MFQRLFETDLLLFTIPGLVGTAVFLMKMGLMTIGGFGADFDMDVDTDVDVELGDTDTDSAFGLLSLQSIAAFLMGFGWGGLIGSFVFDWAVLPSALAGCVFRAALVWLLAVMMKAILSLQGSGHVRIDDAIGAEGAVYATIPNHDEGRGQIRVVVDDRARIYNAVSEGEAIPTGTRVRVTNVNRDNTLTVVKI